MKEYFEYYNDKTKMEKVKNGGKAYNTLVSVNVEGLIKSASINLSRNA